MSITFSSSEKKWCFFFIIIATRRKRRTQRDSETRERNEEKRTFCDRKTDELRTHRRFYHPRPFRRRLRNDLRYLFHILLHHRSTSRSRRRTHSARACAFFSFFSYLRYKNEKRDRRAQRTRCLLSSAIVPTTPSDRPQYFTSFSIIARRREAEEEPIARARARVFFFFSSLLFTRAIFTNEKQEEKKKTKCARAQVHCFLVRDRSERSQIHIPMFYCSSSSLDAWRRNRRRRKTESRRRRRRRRLLRKRAPSRFYICIWVLCISLSPKKARVFFTR